MADLKTLDALSAYNKVANMQNTSGTDSAESSGSSFTDMIQQALGSSIDKVKMAETLSSQTGSDKVNLEDLAVAVANAELSLKTVLAIRDKLISAFQDILRMPI